MNISKTKMDRQKAKKIALLLAISLVIVVVFGIFRTTEKEVQEVKQEATQEQNSSRLEILASNLEIPWGLVFLPDKSLLFTERSGRVRMIDNEGNLLPTPIASIPEVKHIGEGGLLGIAVHSDFENNKYVYLYYTYSSNGDDTLNRVSRYKFEDGKLINEQVIIDVIPGAVNHNGGRIKFGPDKFLYISTGDAQNPSLAQDKNSLAGKILRVTDEGKAPPDNPFADAQDKPTLIYSYGHRNPQGLTFDNQGRLWATEHGPQALDELNLIEKGKNYGWPIIQGDQMREGMVSPVIQSGSTNTWAPAGATFLDGSIFFGGLAGQSLFEYKIADKTLKRYFQEEFGRIREVVLGPDGYLYITTSNTDGRGSPKEGDDRLIKVNPDISR